MIALYVVNLFYLLQVCFCHRLSNDVIVLEANVQKNSGVYEKTADIELDDFLRKRSLLVQAEINLSLGMQIQLTPQERFVNKSFFDLKKSFYNENSFYPRSLFPIIKEKIHSTKCFNAIKMLPKGASLHIHEFSMYSADWLIQNITYRPNLYYCPQNQPVLFKFSKFKPNDSKCKWRSVSEDRNISKNQSSFDLNLKRNFILTTEDLKFDQNTIWTKFLKIFESVKFLLATHIFDDYIYHGLQRFYDDNVQYLEIRFGLLKLYDMNGKEYPVDNTIERFIKVAKQFVRDHPDFLLPKLIMYSVRVESKDDVAADIKQIQKLMLKYPETVIGYDLVGQENLMHPLLYYIDDLISARKTDLPIDMRYFFHAGETDWMGTVADSNLFDAILLNATRIGHAYALIRHPLLYDIVKRRRIPLEINPISNQVLGLLHDMRNHPATTLFADDAPVVISSDDPAMWGAHPLSDDFFMALIALGGKHADLGTAKQLALNSIRFGVLSDAERLKLAQIWERKWNTFIDNFMI